VFRIKWYSAYNSAAIMLDRTRRGKKGKRLLKAKVKNKFSVG